LYFVLWSVEITILVDVTCFAFRNSNFPKSDKPDTQFSDSKPSFSLPLQSKHTITTMLTSLLALFLLPTLLITVLTLHSWHTHWRAARSSNLPYILVPVNFWSPLWQTVSKPVRFLLSSLLPQSCLGTWFNLTHPEWAWIQGFAPFAQLGETFMACTPGGNFLITAEPETIAEICARRNDFGKPVEMYAGVDIYGKNVVTTEGAEWRRHRKGTTGSFGEKSNRVVWMESVYQGQCMSDYWRGMGGKVGEPGEDAMRLSLFVISRAGFDVRCAWPGQDVPLEAGEKGKVGMLGVDRPKGFEMSYVESLESLLKQLLFIIVFPVWLLSKLSFGILKKECY
jgi:hypothetical protein